MGTSTSSPIASCCEKVHEARGRGGEAPADTSGTKQQEVCLPTCMAVVKSTSLLDSVECRRIVGALHSYQEARLVEMICGPFPKNPAFPNCEKASPLRIFQVQSALYLNKAHDL
eukprot:2280672-Rhodomonas_salina.1